MAKVGAQRAAELTGKSKSTIQRAMNSGKLSYELDSNNRRVIDVSELERCFGLSGQQSTIDQPSAAEELNKVANMLEAERMGMRIQILEEQLGAAQEQIEDLKEQRDRWQKQAAQVLITSQYSQKQAEELREEIKLREQKMQVKRQQRLDEKMARLKAQNENANNAAADNQGSNFQGFWKKVKGQR